MSKENITMSPLTEEQNSTQPQPTATPQDMKGLTGVPSAGLVTVPNRIDDICILTQNGPKPLMTRIDELYNGQTDNRYVWDEIGMSRLYADTFSYILRYVSERKKWYIYNGKVWVSADGQEMELCKLLVKKAYEYNSDLLPLLTKKQQGFMGDD